MGEVLTTRIVASFFLPLAFSPILLSFLLYLITLAEGAPSEVYTTLHELPEYICVRLPNQYDRYTIPSDTVLSNHCFSIALVYTVLHPWLVEFCNMQIHAFSTLYLAFALALSWLRCIDLAQAHSVRNTLSRITTGTITASQREQAGISQQVADDVSVALQYERSKWVYGSVSNEEFYRVPSGTADAPAGTLLKLQIDANTTAYTLPPNTAISRFLYQTKNLNGTKVPNSAYILWPYLPRTQPNGGGYPVIAWAHGTTGGFGECAPSHVRDLWADFVAPFPLVLQGYVVVAPDYAGLGVEKDAKGRSVTHEYLAGPSHANDLFYSVQAAQSAFKTLSKQFVVVGHSQGGGAAWGAAQRQALTPVEGYLGSVAGSPVTNFLDIATAATFGSPNLIGPAALIARSIRNVFPEFELSSILTPKGIKLISLLTEIEGCNPAVSELLVDPDFLKPAYFKNFYVQSYRNLTNIGGRPIAGPLLVIHGDSDNIVPFQAIATAVDQTCKNNERARLEFAVFGNVTHEPVMYASQRIWLKWIEDRFADAPAAQQCVRTDYSNPRSYKYYQPETNWYIQGAIAPFQLG